MQKGLGTGSVNTQKEKVLANILLISQLTAMASSDEVNGLYPSKMPLPVLSYTH